MGSHPNVILKCAIKAQGTTRALLRELLAQNRVEVPNDNLPLWLDDAGKVIKNRNDEDMRQSRDDQQLAIGSSVYDTLVMEDTYDEGHQIAGEEGDLIVYDLVTYGYGEEIGWGKLQALVGEVVLWADSHNLTYQISVTANYW